MFLHKERHVRRFTAIHFHISLVYCQVQPVKCRYFLTSDRQRVLKLLLKWSLVLLWTSFSTRRAFMLSNHQLHTVFYVWKQKACLHVTTIIQEQVSFLKLFTLTFQNRCDLFWLALGVTACSLLLEDSFNVSRAVCNRPYGCCASTLITKNETKYLSQLFIIIYLKKIMFLPCIILQSFCGYILCYMWCWTLASAGK